MPCARFNLSAARTLAALLVLLLSLSGCGRSRTPAVQEGVSLSPEFEELEPTTTLELRFDEPVIAPAQVGQPAEPSPLIVQPPIPGRFVWLSQRSGVFTPTAPPALDTRYRVTLRSGLTNTDGRPLRAQLQRTFRTPPFRVSVSHLATWMNTNDAPSEPRLALQFNADLVPRRAQSWFEFRSARGTRVPATVRHAHDDEHFPGGSDDGRRTWRERFTSPATREPDSRRRLPRDPAAETNSPVPGRVVIEPLRALPPEAGWRLVVAQGLPAAETGLSLREPFEVFLGTVQPFEVSSAEAANTVGAGRRVVLHFTKGLAFEVRASNVLDWITLDPQPRELEVLVSWNTVTLRGGFDLKQKYRVSVREGLPSREAFALARPFTTELRFQPVPPRLYFQTFETHQYGSGRREFDLLAVNVDRVRLRARRLDRHTIIHALRGYRSYFRAWDEVAHERYREVDFEAVPGRLIYQTELILNSDADESRRQTLSWNDVLGRGKHGAVFLAAERAESSSNRRATLGTQTLVQLTDLGLVWKSAPDRLWARVFSYATGAAVAGARVQMLTDDNQLLAEATTDAQGMASLPAHAFGRWLLAESGDDLHATPLWEGWRPDMAYFRDGVETQWEPTPALTPQMMLFTDRPLYRPGETVHFQAIARVLESNQWNVPVLANMTLRGFDGRGRKFVEQTNVTFSALGSWSTSVALPESVLGHFQFTLSHSNGLSHSHSVQVQDYKPNAFEVTLHARPAYAAGDTLAVPVQARYLLGAPVSRGKLAWSLEAYDAGFFPPGFERFRFCSHLPYGHELGRGSAPFAVQGEGQMTPAGFTIEPALPLNPRAPQPRQCSLLTELTDLNQQTISQSAAFVRHSSDFYLGLAEFPSAIAAGEPLPVALIAVRADGSPIPDSLQATVRLHRVEWRTTRLQAAGRAPTYRREPEMKSIGERIISTRAVERLGDEWKLTAAETNAVDSLVPPEAGDYLLEATTTDAGGRPVNTAVWLSVYAAQPAAWRIRNESEIDLVPDRAEYRAGDTATIVVKTPIHGEVLVSLERERVLRQFTTNLHAATAIQVPLTDDDAPNVFVSVVLVRGAKDSPRQIPEPSCRMGYCQLRVERPETRLRVQLEIGQPAYRPGDAATVRARVRDSAGHPATGAITLYAVDEGVLSLVSAAAPDPHGFFHQPRALEVRTGASVRSLLSEDPEDLTFGNKGYLIGGGGGAAGALRKNFLPCAFWLADAPLDTHGEASVNFTAPDSLTRYRVVAVVHNARQQFGSAQETFEINKPLMIEPALPRFARVGDRVQARAVVLNQTDHAGSIVVTLELDATARTGTNSSSANPLTQTVSLAARAAAAVEFPIELAEAGAARWVWRARFVDTPKLPAVARGFTDAVEARVPIEPVVPLLREIHLGRTEAATTNLITRAVNPQLLEGRGTVWVRVANTRLVQLNEAVARLLEYPYGCVEQTTSRLIPWLVLADFEDVLPALQAARGRAQESVQRGVRHLLAMQTDAGGLGYWPGARQPMLWASAYGGLALVLAQRRGEAINGDALGQLWNYLGAELRRSIRAGDNSELSDRCFALYTLALAGRPESAYHSLYFDRRDRLSAESRAMLALAIIESGGPREMVEELIAPRHSLPPQDDLWFASPERELAVRLLAWTRFRPGDAQVDILVEELMRAQTDAHWRTTQGNAWAVFALTDYARRVERGRSEARGTLAWGAHATNFALAKDTPVFAAAFATAPALATAPLTVGNPQQRLLFTELKFETRARVARQPRQDRGYAIERRYERVADDGALEPLGSPRIGDRVLVTLRLEARQPAHYVVVDDPLPAVLEPLNPEFKSQQTRAAEVLGLAWESDYRELRADRAVFFRDHLAPGTYTLRYLTRVRAAGTVTAPGTRVEEMYHPERFGLAASEEITARALE